MRAAVIGANSYIARNLIRLNALEGYAETALYDCQAEHIDGERNYRQLDLADLEQLGQAISGCDLIYFFTGKTGTMQGFDQPGAFAEVNERCLFHLLAAYRSVNCQGKILFPSTRLVYRGSETPIPESGEKEFRTPYAIQKFACEQYLEMFSRMFGVKYCVLRLCVPYGTLVSPVSSYGTLDFFLCQAREKRVISVYGDGAQRRTFTYIADLCRALWRAGLEPRCLNDVYNVGGEDCSIRQLAELIAEQAGAEVVYQPWQESAQKIESGSTVFNSEKLDRLLGTRPTMTVQKWTAEKISEEEKKVTIIGNKSTKNSGGGNYVTFTFILPLAFLPFFPAGLNG